MKTLKTVIAVFAVLTIAAVARADYVIQDDFSTYSEGSIIGEAGGWLDEAKTVPWTQTWMNPPGGASLSVNAQTEAVYDSDSATLVGRFFPEALTQVYSVSFQFRLAGYGTVSSTSSDPFAGLKVVKADGLVPLSELCLYYVNYEGVDQWVMTTTRLGGEVVRVFNGAMTDDYFNVELTDINFTDYTYHLVVSRNTTEYYNDDIYFNAMIDSLGGVGFWGKTNGAGEASTDFLINNFEIREFGGGPADVPEPSTFLLLLPFIGFGARKLRRKNLSS